jgi:(p)ppGpp synthase/HD superfamily hydrolase
MKPTLEDTLILACAVHRGQFDKAGKPYILHPLRVMANLGAAASEDERFVALLHDVVEDTGLTPEALRGMGYSDEVLQALELVTKRDGEEYEAFMQRLAPNAMARKVKLADLQDNMDLSRIPNPQPKDYGRLEKYQRAVQYLREYEASVGD